MRGLYKVAHYGGLRNGPGPRVTSVGPVPAAEAAEAITRIARASTPPGATTHVAPYSLLGGAPSSITLPDGSSLSISRGFSQPEPQDSDGRGEGQTEPQDSEGAGADPQDSEGASRRKDGPDPQDSEGAGADPQDSEGDKFDSRWGRGSNRRWSRPEGEPAPKPELSEAEWKIVAGEALRLAAARLARR